MAGSKHVFFFFFNRMILVVAIYELFCILMQMVQAVRCFLAKGVPTSSTLRDVFDIAHSQKKHSAVMGNETQVALPPQLADWLKSVSAEAALSESENAVKRAAQLQNVVYIWA